MWTLTSRVLPLKAREKKEITQAQLGEILGVSSKTISKWETAKGQPMIPCSKNAAADTWSAAVLSVIVVPRLWIQR